MISIHSLRFDVSIDTNGTYGDVFPTTKPDIDQYTWRNKINIKSTQQIQVCLAQKRNWPYSYKPGAYAGQVLSARIKKWIKVSQNHSQLHEANKPQIIELIEDSWHPVKDVYLARRNVERSHGKTVRKRANEQRSDRVNRRHLVGQHGSLRLIAINQKHLTYSQHKPHREVHTAVSARGLDVAGPWVKNGTSASDSFSGYWIIFIRESADHGRLWQHICTLEAPYSTQLTN